MVITSKQEVVLEGLCCPNCAKNIESRISRIKGVSAAAVNFIAQRITIEAADKKRMPLILRRASRIVRDLEPDIRFRVIGQTEEEEGGIRKKRLLTRISLGTGLAHFILALSAGFAPPLSLALFIGSYLLIGGEVVFRALKNITRGEFFDENFLMSAATIGAFAIGEYPEGVAVMLFYQVGEAFQRLAVNRSRSSIAALMDIRPDYANLKEGETIRVVSPEEVVPGDLILVKPGEKVPLDGLVREGNSALDVSALTGESLPRDVAAGSGILSGSINKSGLLVVEVTKPFGESTVAKILDLVQNAGSKKAPVENFITRFARYYTPAVVFSALALALLPPLLIPGAAFGEWIRRALIFLVVSCPCALVISIPLSFFGGIGGASRKGILVKGGNYLEALNRVDTVVFDKTGTLTRGVFKVREIRAQPPRTGADLLLLAARAEWYSNHPIALSVRDALGRDIGGGGISQYEEIPGEGIRVLIDGKQVLAGNGVLLSRQGVSFEEAKPAAGAVPGTVIYLAEEGKFAGCLLISDELKPDSKKAVTDLKALGVRQVVMLTGDNREAGERIAEAAGIDRVYAGLLPQDKVAQLEKIGEEQPGNGSLVFSGDGINDAPVLARSDVGIAMGGLGAGAAIEAADIILMTDEPSRIPLAIRIARKTHRIVWQNIIFALGVKAVVLALGALGFAAMWEAVFADVGVAVIAVLNAMRTMRIRS
jgi:Cd2+/Zn2+-exporting ATPase